MTDEAPRILTDLRSRLLRRYGNRLMRARVGLQLIAVVIFVLLLLTLRSKGG